MKIISIFFGAPMILYHRDAFSAYEEGRMRPFMFGLFSISCKAKDEFSVAFFWNVIGAGGGKPSPASQRIWGGKDVKRIV